MATVGNLKDQILSQVLSSAASRSSRIDDKRRGRRSLSDMCSLFEKAWAAGQRERDQSIPALKFIPRDRAALKILVQQFRDSDFDIEAFAHWSALHWDAIGAQHFPKARSYPELPAFRWLVACLDQYVIAYSNKDSLNETGAVTRKALTKKAAAAESTTTQALQSIAALQRQAKTLQAQLAEANKRLDAADRTGTLPKDDFEEEITSITRKSGVRFKKLDPAKGFAMFDEQPTPPKARRLK